MRWDEFEAPPLSLFYSKYLYLLIIIFFTLTAFDWEMELRYLIAPIDWTEHRNYLKLFFIDSLVIFTCSLI